jgi:hypothetical protein
MHMKEMLEGVAELGVPAGGRRPGNTLHATLSQDRRIELVGTNTWQLTAEEQAAVAATAAAVAQAPAETVAA